jgi:hypothetical protein
MFGYIRPCKQQMKVCEWEYYHAAYCGLCRALGKRGGLPVRAVLQYDCVFLALLFTLEEEPAAPRRIVCPVHPWKREDALPLTPAFEATADVSIFMAWAALKDSIADEGFWIRQAAKAGGLFLNPACHRADTRKPAFARLMAERLRQLRMLENENCPSIDIPADAFGAILEAASDLLPCRGGEHTGRPRRRLLACLGRWVYILDALDDRNEDRKRGRYNPINARYGDTGEPEIAESMTQLLYHLQQDMLSSFALLPEGTATPVLRNILELGMPSTASAVMNKPKR